MLTHSYYEEDPRVRREAETLVASGRPVEVFGLRRPGDAVSGEVAGVRVHRLDVQRHQGAGLRTYLSEYVAFFARAAWAATQAHRRRPFALVQVHTLPDFLVFAGIQFRLAGLPLVLDLHEAMPEFFRMRFPRASNPIVHRLLELQERAAIAAADAAITVNDALADRLVDLGVRRDKITVVLNSPDLTRFDPVRFPGRGFIADGILRLVYAGALTPTYELEVLVEAVAELRRRRSSLPVTLDLYGRGDADGPLRALVAARDLPGAVTFHGRIPIEDVPAAIARADIGVAPTRRSPFTDFSLSTKIFEYGAMGKPVIASRLPMVERTFAADSVATYEPGDPVGLADAILRLVDDAAGREARVAATAERVGELSWAREGERYRALIERLIGRAGGAGVSDEGSHRAAAHRDPNAEAGSDPSAESGPAPSAAYPAR